MLAPTPTAGAPSEPVTSSRADAANGPRYTVSVRHLCDFAAKTGDLDLRHTPAPTAFQGREGHLLVAQRRGAAMEPEIALSLRYGDLLVRGRADGFEADTHTLVEVKTFRGRADRIAANRQALHWAQLKVYGWLMCQARNLQQITLSLLYLDVDDLSEHPVAQNFSALELQTVFEHLCSHYLCWLLQQSEHYAQRNRALEALLFPQMPFRPGQHTLASGVYRTVRTGGTLLAQAPTGIGKTMGTLFPALRAMPARGLDKIFYLTAKTPGRAVALQALRRLRDPGRNTATPHEPTDAADRPSLATQKLTLRVLELVAKEKACEHKDKACHGQSCPLAHQFYERLAAARSAAAQRQWLDQHGLREVALAHQVCPYYLGQEMAKWCDVVVGDYNHYFDRTALLYALTQDAGLKVALLVDEAHNLTSRACGMYSAQISQAQTLALRSDVPAVLRPRVDELLNQWQLLLQDAKGWQELDAVPAPMLRSVQRFNTATSELLAELDARQSTQNPGMLLSFFFNSFEFAALADAFGPHALCELDADAVPDLPGSTSTLEGQAPADLLVGNESARGRINLRCVVPGYFLKSRFLVADSAVLFSATLCPQDYCVNLLGLPGNTPFLDVPSPFDPAQLRVRVIPVSTRRAHRTHTLGRVVTRMAEQHRAEPGNYLAFFSSFDYMEHAARELALLYPDIHVWAQERSMSEPARQAFLNRFLEHGRGIGFAVLGGVFGEGIDLPGKRLIGAFVATLGLPQFNAVNQAISARMEALFGRGHDYTYVLPGLQKVVQAVGRVVRTETDTGTVLLLDDRYLQPRYHQWLPDAWGLGALTPLAADTEGAMPDDLR